MPKAKVKKTNLESGSVIEELEGDIIIGIKNDSDLKIKIKGKKATLEEKIDYIIELLGGNI
jgi:hypothetical protein